MESRSTNRMMIALLVLLLGAAVFGIVRFVGFTRALSDNPWQNYKNDLLAWAHTDFVAAQGRWNSHRLAHYRLTIDRIGPAPEAASPPACQQDVEVRDETVTATFQDTCTSADASRWAPMSPDWQPPSPRFEATVSQLWATLERDTTRIYWTAQGVGCLFIALEATYDGQLGYPTRLHYHLQPPPSQMGFPVRADYFLPDEPAPDPQGCPAVGPLNDGPTVTVHLSPMQ